MVRYAEMIRPTAKFDTRVRVVQYALKHSVSAAARTFGTTRNTIRLWLARYKAQGTAGMRDRSHAPHRIPHKTSKALEAAVLALRNLLPTWGQDRLKRQFKLPCSTWAIHRILQQHGFIDRKRRLKYRRKRDLRAIKATWPAFSVVQVDGKDLNDIPRYWPQRMHLKLPRYQLTARDVRTGTLYFAFAYENTLTNACLFGSYLAQTEESSPPLP